MKRFKYSLENVLHYKEQILDSIKAEHGTLLAQIRKKEAEIQELENKLVSAQNKMDDLKKQDVQIKDICLYGMYISHDKRMNDYPLSILFLLYFIFLSF